MRELRFATLTSSLARSQTESVVDRLTAERPGASCALDILPSPVVGDENRNEVFVALSPKEITFLQQRLLDEACDLVVVEAADVSLPLPAGLSLLCVTTRATPFDAYLNRQGMIMDEMDPGSRIGVMSMRSRCQMAPHWPDLKFEIIRGGVDRAMETHLRKSEIDGLILPAAVTENLGIQGIVAEMFAPDFILPSPGQGILALIGRTADAAAQEFIAPLHSPETAVEMTVERAFCDHMVKDQDLPVGALATVADDEVQIVGATGACANRFLVTGSLDEADAVGAGLAAQILSSGASLADLLEAEFPDGLPAETTDPDDPDDPGNNGKADEDAAIVDEEQFTADDRDAAPETLDFDDLEHMRALEHLAGIESESAVKDDDDEDDEDYD